MEEHLDARKAIHQEVMSPKLDEVTDETRASAAGSSNAKEAPRPESAEPPGLQIIGQEMVPFNAGAGRGKGGGAMTSSESLELVPATPPRSSAKVTEKSSQYRSVRSLEDRGVEPGPKGKPQSLAPVPWLPKIEASGKTSPLVPIDLENARRLGWEAEDPAGFEGFVRRQFEASGRQEAEKLSEVDEVSWKLKMEQDLKEMGLLLRAAHHENAKLRYELECRSSSKFSTPEDAKTDEASRRRKEDGQTGQQEKGSKEDGPRGQQAEEAEQKIPLGGGLGGAKNPQSGEPTMQIILKLMEGMQSMQRQLLSSREEGRAEEPEIVKYNPDLPRLAEWSQESAPIDYNDWLLCIHPHMADLSQSSAEWWDLTVHHARQWYDCHMKLSPLERLGHVPKMDEALCQPRWGRLERRAASLLLSAIPSQLREEVVASKMMSALGILAKGMTTYQPGGLSERAAILNSLESPTESSTTAGAIQTLRKWIRWLHRAEELGVSVPDASILIKGLTKLMRRVVQTNQELSFRLSLVRNSLMVDVLPSHTNVKQYAQHLLAELEQMGQQKKSDGVPESGPKAKRLEEAGRLEGQKMKFQEGEAREAKPCKFYLTEQGCRKGKSCKFSHELKDEKRRCFACGSTQHLSPSCPTKEANTSSSPPKTASLKTKAVKKEAEEEGEEQQEEAAGDEEPKEEEKVSSILEEANKMLKSLMTKPSTTPSSRLDSLQKELDELRKGSKKVKTLRLTRIQAGASKESGLLDSGATHALRCSWPGENLNQYEKVWVTLADGHRIQLYMTPTGVMVTENQEAEPIIPCSWLDKLGYKIVWSDGKVLVDHPERRSLKVHLDDGCPQIARSEAIKLLREFEEKFPVEKLLRRLEMKCDDEVQKEVGWMHELLEVHPVLKGLPKHVKESLVVAPGSWSDLPANRHARKKLKGGFLCHLYAGPKEGFTLKKALAELNHGAKILEVDILRGADHDVSGHSSKAYKGLLRAALDGELHGLVSGPNCRTRSILRFHEVLGGPRPVRGWNGEEWGLNDLSPDEQQQVEMDDVLMWRMIFLAIVAKYGLAVVSPLKVFRFAVEQPMEPHYEPRCVSFWLTPEWLALKEMYGWEEQGFNQGDYAEGPVPVKPTKFGGNLKLRLPEKLNSEARGRSHSASVKSSKSPN